ncbi:hypothetical protein ACUODJ_20680, partial [Escherichia sp. HC-CC]
GVDAKSGLTHSLVTTAANEHDLNQLVIVSGFIFDAENAWVSISLAAFASIFIAYIYARFIDYPLYRALKRQIAKIS